LEVDLKSTRGVHFTILPASPCAAEFYEIWHTRSTHQRNHVCEIFSRSVHGLQSSDTPKLPFPIDLLQRPYNSVRTALRHCDPQLSLSVLTAIFQGGRGLTDTRMTPFWILLELRVMEVVVITGTYKAPVKMSPPTNQHPVFLQARCPSCRPANSVRALVEMCTANTSTISSLYVTDLFFQRSLQVRPGPPKNNH